ncbi:hypothetical protein LCGC14_1171990 [marine sediment metagenome]|uniref:DUF2292 domain-containing protein n=1 Tax=marine sediment metagenome TaxID=412755 RepID=A0A0F9LUG7_9ZZZZ
MQKLEQLLADLEKQRFYGSVEVKFESGRVVLVRKTETIKVVHHPGTGGKDNGRD